MFAAYRTSHLLFHRSHRRGPAEAHGGLQLRPLGIDPLLQDLLLPLLILLQTIQHLRKLTRSLDENKKRPGVAAKKKNKTISVEKKESNAGSVRGMRRHE